MPRILMVDDDPAITQIFRGLFERDGYEVDVANSGYVALDKAVASPPDIMLLDIILPGIDGFQVLRELRGRPETKLLPVIVFSNAFMSEGTDDDLREGPTLFLPKSDCSPEQLLKEIQTMLIASGVGQASSLAELGGDPTFPPAQGADTAFYNRQISRSFVEHAPDIVAALRSRWQAVIKAESDDLRIAHLKDLSRIASSTARHASIAGFERTAQISAAFEALLLELYDDPLSINASTNRTMAHAVDFLIHLLETNSQPIHSQPIIGVALAVDDETTSLWAVASALEIAQLRPITINTPEIALEVLKQNRFDLIFTDVEMPNKNGYDLCKELRTFTTNRKTPVVFVTGLSDFSSRAKSTLSGGNDFIAKPFLLSELAVKALIHLFKSREEQKK